MKRTFLLAIIALCIFQGTSGCKGDGKYANRLDEIKQTYNLPAEAVVIRELGSPSKDGASSESHMWCLFVLGGDTILYHHANDGTKYESMCRVSWGAVQKTEAEADTLIE